MTKPTIIVIGSADVIKLSLIRSLGELGYKLISIHLGRKLIIKPLDYYSKYISSYYFVNRSNLIDFLVQNCVDVDCKPVLFPLDDASVYIIDKAHHILEKHFYYAHVNHKEGGIVELMNKSIQKAIAAESGLIVAKGWRIPYTDGEYIIPEGIEYPCFVKGELSYGGNKSLQRKCNNYNELRKLLDESLSSCKIPFIAEEFLPIKKNIGIIGVFDGVNCIMAAKAELLVMGKGMSNGVSMFGKVSQLRDLILLKKIEAMLKEMHYTGIFNLDFVESRGELYFLEMNYRYAAYGYGLKSAGLNLPNLFVKSMYDNKTENIHLTMDKDLFYFNEKVGLHNVLERFISWSEYKLLEKKADVLLVRSKDDSKPYRMFFLSICQRIMIKRLSVIYRKYFHRHI